MIRACVTADNQWRIHEDDLPDPEMRSIWQDILHSRAAIGDAQTPRHLPVPKLRWAVAVVEAFAGSEIAHWRGQRAYQREMRANAALPEHLRKVY